MRLLKIAALASVILIGSVTASVGFFWFVTGVVVGSAMSSNGETHYASANNTFGIPARCWTVEKAEEYGFCRAPSMIRELTAGDSPFCRVSYDKVSTDNGRENEYHIYVRRFKDLDTHRVCNMEWHMKLEWQMIQKTKEAAFKKSMKIDN